MSKENKPEVWLRGPVENIPGLLQPVAHALLQAREEVNKIVAAFPDTYLWQKPAGVASVGFHLQHLTGVLDRLFTYAEERSLSESQLSSLAAEGKPVTGNNSVNHLTLLFNQQVDKALKRLEETDEQTLTQQRLVGRSKIPSTVIGLLFHAAEHTMRHVGQLYVTATIIKDNLNNRL
ncbi:MAG TPA: DinB family protein [Segetibacter sp.]|nr:DinB family protein [Segetibacter sp.]